MQVFEEKCDKLYAGRYAQKAVCTRNLYTAAHMTRLAHASVRLTADGK